MQLGLIVVWSGAITDIPLGWHLCDGEKSTVDLRDLFVVGAGDSYDPGDTGGIVDHTHDFTGDGHAHVLVGGEGIKAGTGYSATLDNSPLTGTTDIAGELPPYYALAYIQKILGV